MDYPSGKSSKHSGPHTRTTWDQHQGQRHGNTADQQHFANSLDRQHRHRIVGSKERQSSSLERQHRSRLDTSLEYSQSGWDSMERLHRYRTGYTSGPTSDQQHPGGGSSLERLQRLRTGSGAELQQMRSSRQWRHGSGSSLERLHGNRTGSSGVDQQQGGGVARPSCPVAGTELKPSSKHGKESPKKQKQSVTEKRVEELSRQLEEEKVTSRRTISRLQRDLTRLKSERAHHSQRDGREGVMKEVERERMLRVDTEQRLQEMREESDSCRARLHALQEEFRKMEDMVRDMLQYKTKIDQLKQEKANLAVTYESNVQKCRNHISTLERENMMLLNQVKKMESQLHGKGDDRDKSRLLLERLKMVEGENSSLVLENEQQRQQYEKCLDQIANQVVQALLAQKTLREECLKLQNRVHDLEMQNRQLNMMFQQRVRFPSDPGMQRMPYTAGTTYVYHEGGEGEATSAQFLQGSAVSLQSMFSETIFEDAPGYPQMSTPPPWLRDHLELPLDDEISLSSSSASGSPSSPGQPTHPCLQAIGKARPSPSASSAVIPVPGPTTKIETEFPATNASPKMKHVSVSERGTRSLERRGEGFQKPSSFHPLICSVGPARGSTGSVRKGKGRSSSETLAMNQLSEQAWQKLEAQVKGHRSAVKQAVSSVKQSTSAEVIVNAAAAPNSPAFSQRLSSSPASEKAGDRTRDSTAGTGKGQGQTVSQAKEVSKSSPRKAGMNGKSSQVSPLFTKVKLRRKGSNSSRDSSRSPHRSAVRNSMPPSMPHHSQYYYDYSDEDSDSRPVSRVYSCASTVSLNELLDTSAEGEFALDDDFFSDWSSMCLSPQHRLPILPTNPHLHPSPPEQAVAKTPGQSGSPRYASGGSRLHHKLLSHNFREREAGRGGGGAKTEREDSGCEVEASHSDRSESWQCDSGAGGDGGAGLRHGGDTCAVMAVETGAVIKATTDTVSTSNSDRARVSTGQNSECVPSQDSCARPVSDPTAVVCTVSVPSKAVTRVPLPSPQAAVLIQSAWSRSDSEQSPTSESSCAGSPEKPSPNAALGVTSLGDTDQDPAVSSNNSPRSSTTDMPFRSSGDRSEVFVPTSKLKSKPLTAEEKSRACRPDQLILAPADKTVHGFTSSSSCSSEDKSPFPQPQSAESHLRQCSRTAGEACVLKDPQASSKPKKSPPPPPVPHKSSKPHPGAKQFTSHSHVDISSVSTKSSSCVSNTENSVGVNSISSIGGISTDGGISSKQGGASVGGESFPPETTLTVGFMSVQPQQLDQVARNPDTVRDFVNSLVRDMKERVARQSDWPITTTPSTTTTGPLAYCKSLDSSFESVRAERSGSKDDGYSTMSSDIHPVAMDKYSYVDIMVAKPTTEVTSSVRKTPDLVHDLNLVGSPKKRNKSTEASETDSAMETSAHSMDTRNSSHSLSSQVSSSSGENMLSPGAKVTKMARFFEEECAKSSGSSTTTTTHPLSVGTPSPLSPTGGSSLGSGDSSVYLSPKSSLTSPESEGSFKQMYASVVAKLTPMPGPLAVSEPGQMCEGGGMSPSPVVSPTSGPVSPSPTSTLSGSVGQRIHDMVHSFQAGLKDKAVLAMSSCAEDSSSPSTPQSQSGAVPPPEKISDPSPPHRPSDFRPSPERRMVRSPICDFKKYEINDPSKRNLSCSPPVDTVTRRENVMSWPPRKIIPPLTPSPMSPVGHTPGMGWDMAPSPLLMMEDKVLDDIPEESDDDWDNLCARSSQDRQQAPGLKEGKGRSCSSSGGSSPRPGHRPMKKCKSESSLWEKPRTMSLYDEMMSGSWDSGKVLERSASVSEVDFRPSQNGLEDQGYLRSSFLHLSFDDSHIQEKVAMLLGCSWHEGSDSEAEARRELNDLWQTLLAQRPLTHCPPTEMTGNQNGTPSTSTEEHTNSKSSAKPSTTPVTSNEPCPQNKDKTRTDQSISGSKGGEEAKAKVDEDSSDDGPRSPSVAQKLFHSEFYSLCPVDSNRSLASSMGSVYQRSREHLNEDGTADSLQSHPPHPSFTNAIHVREFDKISHQIASLSRTVDELNRSLNSLTSGGASLGGSKQDLQDSDNAEEGQGKEAGEGGGAWSSSRQECIEGYHWVEDEFYLTSCGGEVIIGSAALLAEEEGMEDYCDGGGGEGGGMFAMEDNDDAIADDAQDDFYCIRMPPRREGRGTGPPPTRPVSGGSDLDHILNSLAHFRYNSDGQLSRQPATSSERPASGQLEGTGGWTMDSSHSHSSLSHALHASTSIITSTSTTTADERGSQGGEVEGVVEEGSGAVGDGDSEGNVLANREQRATILDSMLPSGGESNDSLSSDIGLDHMMCQRLMGRKGRKEVVRFSAFRQRPALNLSHFFQHYNKMEQDAVAAFDFLEDLSTSESTEHLDSSHDSATRRCRSASQPLSREVVMRQTQARQQQQEEGEGPCAARNPRPLSESDFRKFRLPANQAGWQDQRYPSYYSYTPPPPPLPRREPITKRGVDVGQTGDTAAPSPSTPSRRHKVRRRRKRSEVKDKGQSKEVKPAESGSSGGGKGGMPSSRAGGRGSRGRRGGERLHKEWHDIKVGDPVANTLSLSDSCCDSSSSPSPPSLSYTDLSKF
ncbi:uncharacterized protein LOC143286749 isoform X2 [Babylonia areolata]|uniref:uncharacterized protein LOC143286749 isoform X2 n=1 Tax=Babylonia areolata TaxID=304850 RepID=UPI003FD57795